MRSSISEGRTEGRVAKAIEEQTSKLPSDVFLWGALGSMGLSLAFMLRKQKDVASFIGTWVPTLLLFGVYNKIVKTVGSDSEDRVD